MFDKYCGSQFSHTVHLITVTDRSPYSECRFHSNIKAMLDKWSQNTVEILFWLMIRAGKVFHPSVSTDGFYI